MEQIIYQTPFHCSLCPFLLLCVCFPSLSLSSSLCCHHYFCLCTETNIVYTLALHWLLCTIAKAAAFSHSFWYRYLGCLLLNWTISRVFWVRFALLFSIFMPESLWSLLFLHCFIVFLLFFFVFHALCSLVYLTMECIMSYMCAHRLFTLAHLLNVIDAFARDSERVSGWICT